jgi:hypothetical protein
MIKMKIVPTRISAQRGRGGAERMWEGGPVRGEREVDQQTKVIPEDLEVEDGGEGRDDGSGDVRQDRQTGDHRCALFARDI